MSTKTTLFLTHDNEHCYYDCSEEELISGEFVQPIYLEFSKENVQVIENDSQDLILRIKPNTEIYGMIQKMNVESEKKTNFKDDLEKLINRYSIENLSNTHDFILADFLVKCLAAYNEAKNKSIELQRGQDKV